MLDVPRYPDRTRHRVRQIWDGAFAPRPDLVSKQPETTEPVHPDLPFGHDTALMTSNVRNRRRLDDEPVIGKSDLQRGMIEIQSRPSLEGGCECLVEFPAHADNLIAGTQWDPVKVDGCDSAPALVRHEPSALTLACRRAIERRRISKPHAALRSICGTSKTQGVGCLPRQATPCELRTRALSGSG